MKREGTKNWLVRGQRGGRTERRGRGERTQGKKGRRRGTRREEDHVNEVTRQEKARECKWVSG